MIDHITFGVSDLAASCAFYDHALKPLGLTRLVEMSEDGVLISAYGKDAPELWLVQERPITGLLHIAFAASDHEQVSAFHAAGLVAGGTDNGTPGLRAHYHADYYAAFLRDPDGHNIEAVCHLPQG